MNSKKFYNSANTYHVNLNAGALTADHNIVFPDLAGTLALTAGAQTLTDKTLTTPIIDGVTFSANNKHQIIVDHSILVADSIHAAPFAIWTAPADSIILRVIVNITTKSTGASTLDVGYTAASATTSSDTLLDGIDSGTAIGLWDSQDASLDTQTNTKAQLAASGKWITVDDKTGDCSGLLGVAYIFYIVI
jgi:uncharacterized protein YqfA (UPF0365 family)